MANKNSIDPLRGVRRFFRRIATAMREIGRRRRRWEEKVWAAVVKRRQLLSRRKTDKKR